MLGDVQQMAKVEIRCKNCYRTFETENSSTAGEFIGGFFGAAVGTFLLGPLLTAKGGKMGAKLGGKKSSCECPYCGAKNKFD